MNRHQIPKPIALIPAAGIGSRMQSLCPKQYLKIGDKTIVEHAIAALLTHASIDKIIVALHPNDTVFKTLPVSRDPRIITTKGGDTRAQSVLAGLKHVDPEYDWVVVHDAARPCLKPLDLSNLIDAAVLSESGAILAAPTNDTIKQAAVGEMRISHTVERALLWRALTPQMFPVELLSLCLNKALKDNVSVTDEASALEYCGFHPTLVSGRADNIKVTLPEDLALAEFYLSHLS